MSVTDALTPLGVALSIGEYLCRKAHTWNGRSTWMGETLEQNFDTGRWSLGALGPDLYGGTSGIALFLAEVYARAGREPLREMAISAMHHAFAQQQQIPREQRFGFYAGRVGIAAAATRAGHLLESPDLIDEAERLLDSLVENDGEYHLLDLISGAASGIVGLFALAKHFERDDLHGLAIQLGDRILASAESSKDGYSWGESATGFPAARNLTGLAHGAAGMGLALYHLYHVTGDIRYRDAASEAFRYENAWFQEADDNWPDFRTFDGDIAPAPCMVAWCHGSVGIGLSRLRALKIHPDEQHYLDVGAAIRSAKRALTDSEADGAADWSLCHGLAGVCDFLLSASRELADGEAAAISRVAAESAAARYALQLGQWPCGPGRAAHPSLMLGLAGVGYLYLRLENQDAPSPLLPDMPVAPATTRT